jgi:hypothetical protein
MDNISLVFIFGVSHQDLTLDIYLGETSPRKIKSLISLLRNSESIPHFPKI